MLALILPRPSYEIQARDRRVLNIAYTFTGAVELAQVYNIPTIVVKTRSILGCIPHRKRQVVYLPR